MKFVIIILLSVVSANFVNGQNNAPPYKEPPAPRDSGVRVFTFVEQMPEFPGGETALRAFLANNVRYPARERRRNIQGKVVVRFVVDEEGAVKDVVVEGESAQN